MLPFISIEALKQFLTVSLQASGNLDDVIVPALLAAGLDVTVVIREGPNRTFPSDARVVTADYTSLASLTSILQNTDPVVSLLVDLEAHRASLWDGGSTTFRAMNVQDIAVAVTRLLTN